MAARLLSASSDRLAAPLSWSADLSPSRAKAGEYRWDLPLALPVQRVRVELAQANSLAPVSVTGRREGRVQWQALSRGLLYRLPQDGQEVLHNELELHRAPVQQLRLQVDERGGGLGGAAPTIRVGIRATQVVFLARGAPPYVLAVGNATGVTANLPLSTLIPATTTSAWRPWVWRLWSRGRCSSWRQVPSRRPAGTGSAWDYGPSCSP